MQYILGLPTDQVQLIQEFGTAEAIAEISNKAENLGYHGVFVTDHPIPPASFVSSGGHHALDPMVALATAATATSRLKILTNLLIVAYRNPFLAAKSIATLDNISKGRLILGVGAGYLKEEFEAAGVSFETRGETLNDHIEVMQKVWAGDPVSITGVGYQAKEVLARPRPTQQAGQYSPPIWVGGNSNNAIDRVVRYGQGWIPMPTPKGVDKFVQTSPINDLESLEKRINSLLEKWTQNNREGKPTIAIGPWDAGHFGTEKWDPETYLTRIQQLTDLGVTHVPIMLSALGGAGTTRTEFLERVEAFAQFADLSA